MCTSLIDKIRTLEEMLLQPAVRSSAERLAKLLDDDFVEFGSSGKTYSKVQIVNRLPHETGVAYTMLDFKMRQLAPDVVFTTYRTARLIGSQGQPSYALRCSIWKHSGGHWRMVFHQGTPTTV